LMKYGGHMLPAGSASPSGANMRKVTLPLGQPSRGTDASGSASALVASAGEASVPVERASSGAESRVPPSRGEEPVDVAGMDADSAVDGVELAWATLLAAECEVASRPASAVPRRRSPPHAPTMSPDARTPASCSRVILER